MPIMFLPLIMYHTWMEMVFGPFLKQTKENIDVAADAAKTMQTQSTPV